MCAVSVRGVRETVSATVLASVDMPVFLASTPSGSEIVDSGASKSVCGDAALSRLIEAAEA